MRAVIIMMYALIGMTVLRAWLKFPLNGGGDLAGMILFAALVWSILFWIDSILHADEEARRALGGAAARCCPDCKKESPQAP